MSTVLLCLHSNSSPAVPPGIYCYMHRIVGSIQQKAAVQTTGLAAKQSDTDIPWGRCLSNVSKLKCRKDVPPSIFLGLWCVHSGKQISQTIIHAFTTARRAAQLKQKASDLPQAAHQLVPATAGRWRLYQWAVGTGTECTSVRLAVPVAPENMPSALKVQMPCLRPITHQTTTTIASIPAAKWG